MPKRQHPRQRCPICGAAELLSAIRPHADRRFGPVVERLARELDQVLREHRAKEGTQ
jgi:hypothetical protein